MTKEEYARLLNSDYWKGYSYSIIKERNYTCEDCGRRFYNERNKLQVHHLVYRDVKPWSYKPEELIVLCDECHKRRHGIITESRLPSSSLPTQDTMGGYSKTYSYHTDDKTNIIEKFYPVWRYARKHKKQVLYAIAVLFVFVMAMNETTKREVEEEEQKEKVVPTLHEASKVATESPHLSKHGMVTTDNVVEEVDANLEEQEESPVVESLIEDTLLGVEPSSLKNKEQSDVSVENESNKEPSTLEILERKNHADVVKQAKRAGVSTEGSTMEILERINHADVVKQAKRAGVSTEGSTMEILERINHADVVKQAKRAGVSTEGSTMEILERINRKELEKFNY